MNKAEKYWEERAQSYKMDIRGVLFKKPYPAFVNTWFHNWSLSQAKKLLQQKSDSKVLDVACGWGRMSQGLLDEFPDITIRGVDLSKEYVELYSHLLSPRGKATRGNMKNLHFANNMFDAAYLVVSLMYLPAKSEQKKALTEILRVLKKGSNFLLIERTPLMGLFDIRQRFKKNGHKQLSFTTSQIHALMKSTKGRVKSINAWPHPLIPLYKAYFIEKV